MVIHLYTGDFVFCIIFYVPVVSKSGSDFSDIQSKNHVKTLELHLSYLALNDRSRQVSNMAIKSIKSPYIDGWRPILRLYFKIGSRTEYTQLVNRSGLRFL